jgi:uncharacterized protein YcbX
MRLARIRRYPVKGFRGHDLDRATLECDRGIPFDRHLAILIPPLPDTATTDRGRLPYFYLARNPKLAEFAVDWDGGRRFTFRSPGGERVAVDTGSPDDLYELNRALARWFADATNPPEISPARPDGGYWDFSDTGLSIINLATVADIGRTAQRRLDPARFRGNLYIDGLPAWREFDLIGRRIRMGSVEVAILRGIRRCNATSIDPDSMTMDFNMPAHLRSAYGHIYCGVYGRVTIGGTIEKNDSLHVVGDIGADPYELKAPTSPPPHEWPRFVVASASSGGGWKLQSTLGSWPLLEPDGPAAIRLHPTGAGSETQKIALQRTTRSGEYEVEPLPAPWRAGDPMLISGPYRLEAA